MKKAKADSQVDLEYEGHLEDGTLFDTNIAEVAKKEGVFTQERGYDPLKVKLGSGSLIKGFESAVVGMAEGETKEIIVDPQEGYGEERPDLIKEVPKDFFQGKEVHPNDWVMVTVQGKNMPTRVHEAGPKYSLNFNYPLAGKVLKFKIKLLKVED